MNKKICVEKRLQNSERHYFNKLGDWRPRLIIWPEYDGCVKDVLEESGKEISDEVDDEWGIIISESLKKLKNENGLQCAVLVFIEEGGFLRNKKGYRLFQEGKEWELKKWDGSSQGPLVNLDNAYFNYQQHTGHEEATFLLHNNPLHEKLIKNCKNYLLFDRTNLLPLGTVIFEHGIEEAVLEMSFAEKEHEFVAILHDSALKYGYAFEQTERHFLSHWIIANKKEFQGRYGNHWDQF